MNLLYDNCYNYISLKIVSDTSFQKRFSFVMIYNLIKIKDIHYLRNGQLYEKVFLNLCYIPEQLPRLCIVLDN